MVNGADILTKPLTKIIKKLLVSGHSDLIKSSFKNDVVTLSQNVPHYSQPKRQSNVTLNVSPFNSHNMYIFHYISFIKACIGLREINLSFIHLHGSDECHQVFRVNL